jgi:ParB/RepB/Spo0J family partition protein
VKIIQTKRLRKNPLTPVLYFVDSNFENLVSSISLFGVLEPLIVYPISEEPGYFQVVSGNRRLNAVTQLGLMEVPCVIVKPVELTEARVSARQEYREKQPSDIIRESRILERGTGWSPSTLIKKDFTNQLIALLQNTGSDNINQGILLGILKEMNDKIISLQEEIREMANIAVPKSEADDILNIDEAMAFLGFKKSTIYSKVNRAEIPHMKRGKRLYFSLKELKNYLRNGKRLTNDEVNEMAKKYLNGEK